MTERATRIEGHKTSNGRDGSEPLPPRQRSRVSNGTALFVQGDGRGAWARRYRDLIVDFASDLGGSDRLSEAQVTLIRRAACLVIECERIEGELSTGGKPELDAYTTASNSLQRLMRSLYGSSLERKSRAVGSLDPLTYASLRATEGVSEDYKGPPGNEPQRKVTRATARKNSA